MTFSGKVNFRKPSPIHEKAKKATMAGGSITQETKNLTEKRVRGVAYT